MGSGERRDANLTAANQCVSRQGNPEAETNGAASQEGRIGQMHVSRKAKF
jgi:hypothetical protein